MVALPAGSYLSLLFLWHLPFPDGFVGARKNIALPHHSYAIVAAVNLAGSQCSFINGSFSDRRIFYPGQLASHAHSNSQGMESDPSLFIGRDICSLRKYE